MESNREEKGVQRRRMEWNRMEWKLKWREGHEMRQKEREHTRKCYRPTGGWAVRMKNVRIVQVPGNQTSGPGRPIMGYLDHMRSSVSCLVTFGKSYRTSGENKRKREKKSSMRTDKQYRDKIAAFEQSWSVTVRMLSKPLESRSLTIRSIATVSNGRAVRSVVMGQCGTRGQEVLTLVA